MLAVLAWCGVVAVLTGFLAASQARDRRDDDQRLQARVQTAAEFSSLYVKDVLTRQRSQAAIWLMGPRVTRHSLARASSAVGFTAAVLLDRRGRVLQAVPSPPGLPGQPIATWYPELAAAAAGRAGVSNVVRSTAGIPLTLALPFTAASGQRIFTGDLDASHTLLGSYISHVIVVPGRRVYLIDARGNLIASSGPGRRASATLATADPRLARLITKQTGAYDSARGVQFFVSESIPATPWRIVAAVPESQLYESLNGADRWLAWVAVAGLGIAGLIIIGMGSRLVRTRERLLVLNRQLEELARVDPLTGLSNRRAVEATLLASISAGRRSRSPVAVLLIDIDHFKQVNDTWGHQAGDALLVSIAQTIQSVLRIEDAVGRWGGEEFLAVLPHTDADGAVIIAERLRDRIAARGSDSSAAPPAVTVTIGAAIWTAGGITDLIRRADHALYAGKAAGRNIVQLAGSESIPSTTASEPADA